MMYPSSTCSSKAAAYTHFIILFHFHESTHHMRLRVTFDLYKARRVSIQQSMSKIQKCFGIQHHSSQ